MCVQYWPAGRDREEVYSGVGVTVENEEQLANFMIRTIRLRKVRKLALSHLHKNTSFLSVVTSQLPVLVWPIEFLIGSDD